jgi:hypothetical protein
MVPKDLRREFDALFLLVSWAPGSFGKRGPVEYSKDLQQWQFGFCQRSWTKAILGVAAGFRCIAPLVVSWSQNGFLQQQTLFQFFFCLSFCVSRDFVLCNRIATLLMKSRLISLFDRGREKKDGTFSLTYVHLCATSTCLRCWNHIKGPHLCTA